MPVKFKISVANSVKKALKKVPLPWQERISKAIDALEEDPLIGEKMWGDLLGKRKLKIWPYRIVYMVDKGEKIVRIIKIGHRQGIYK